MTVVSKISENIYRIQNHNGKPCRESLLSKYGIINTLPDGKIYETIKTESSSASVGIDEYTLDFSLSSDSEGFDISFFIDENERIFGLGDESRDTIEKRGKIAHMKTENVHSYGPIPFILSSRGWAVMINCTYHHIFDIASTEKNTIRIYGKKGTLDMFVFCGKSMREALYISGRVSGRPVMLPKSAYGLTFVMNEETDAYRLLDCALRFNDRDIPCDILGLEPSWMSKHYDFSINKSWNKEKFPLPSWKPDGYYGYWSFIWNLHRMGKKLSLWLCNSYDLLWKEEGVHCKEEVSSFDDAEIIDPRLLKGERLDKITDINTEWFEHLKKFVDNGACAFKLDGATQVDLHPDRLWAGRYTDDEIHNLYPVVYAKQMKEGYEKHTGKRAMINTCASYIGTSQYAATWAGDTGCNPKVLLSLMNFAMCGHSNASFDMIIDSKENIHIGFLAPWSQHMAWANYMFPWFCGIDTEDCYRYYSKLRSSLFPYIYSFAHVANQTSYPLLRPLSLEYPNTSKYDRVFNEFKFGDSLLVSAFDTHITLPSEDSWYDFYTGKLWEGEKEFDYEPPEGKGGAIFVRAGSVIPMQAPALSLSDYRPNKLYIHVYPGKDTEFLLYEDDYTTYSYEKSEFAITKFELKNDVLYIYPRNGSFDGMHAPYDLEVIWHNTDGSEKHLCIAKEEYSKEKLAVRI